MLVVLKDLGECPRVKQQWTARERCVRIYGKRLKKLGILLRGGGGGGRKLEAAEESMEYSIASQSF